MGEEFELKRKEIQNSIEDLKIERSQLGERLLGLQKEKSQVDSQIDEAQKAYNSRYLETILSLERERSRFDGQIYELKRVENLLALIEEYKNTYDLLATDEARIRRELNDAYANAERDKSSIRELEDLFLECLKRSKFPDIDENHFVTINTQDFLPRIKNRQNDIYQAQFANLGSGGKKTLFKACFAVAVHRFARRRNNPLFPSFLIIDGPMKNLSKNENPEIYQGFYEYVYELKAGELKDTQLIFVDSEFFKPNLENYPGLDVKEQQMMLDDPSHPRLIPGYRD